MPRAGVVHEPGSAVVVRTVTAGRVRWASAAVCVRDDAEAIAFYQSHLGANKVTAGAAARWPDRPTRELALRDELARGEFPLVDKVPTKRSPTLTVAHADDWFSVRFVHRAAWVPEYVNVCLPFRRSTIGFDTDDLCLDLVLTQRADGTTVWESKDDDDLDGRAAMRIYTDAQVRAIRDAGASAMDRLSRGAAPFDGGWADWSIDPAWEVPADLPGSWADDLIDLRFA